MTMNSRERVRTALAHREPDRVPISDFFWGGFIRRWREELGLPDDANPYYHYDLDWIVTVPNMDPQIRSFETIREDEHEVVVKTGFGAILRKKFDFPMPEFMDWEVDTIEKLEAFEFEDAYSPARYFEGGDNQIAGVGDGFDERLMTRLADVGTGNFYYVPHVEVLAGIFEKELLLISKMSAVIKAAQASDNGASSFRS